MKINTISHHHGIIIIPFLLLLLVPEVTIPAGAQPGSNQARDDNLYSYGTFSPTLAIIIAVIITSLFFMVFFSVYIRQCSGRNSASLPTNARGGRAVALGLDRSIIETFPTFTYSEVKEHKINVDGGLECAVCLNEFEDDETLRLIPKCDHVFHPGCIDAWLGSHVTCPVCRADLVPQPENEPVRVPDLTTNDILERSRSRNGEILIQVVDESQSQSQSQERDGHTNRNLSFGNLNRLARSWSLGPKRFGLGKFRSFSTGHSLVQPEENLNRFTLRLPANVRREMINRTSLNVDMLPKEGSSRKGYRPWTGEEGSNRSDGRLDRSDRRVKSDRWAFLARALSMKSPRVAEMDKSFDSDSKRDETGTQTKLPSLSCLEPKVVEQTGLFSHEPTKF